jgi:hypothetical protein
MHHLSKQRREIIGASITDCFVAANASARVDGCCAVVCTSLTDIAVGDSQDLRAVPVAVRCLLAGALA